MDLSNSNIKNKFFLIFQEMETQKKVLIFSQKKAFLIFRESGPLIFQQIKFSSPKNKKFQERTSEPEKKTLLKMVLFSHKIRNFLIFQ